MPNVSARALGELFALVGVILSLIFVGLELRQSTIASRAAAYQEVGIATANIWYLQASNPELNEIFWQAVSNEDGYSNLSESDKRIFLSHQVATLRLYETVYLQVEQGLLERSALESLGWKGFVTFLSGRNSILSEIENFIDPSFAEYLRTIGAYQN
jgi:hypothetical protein